MTSAVAAANLLKFEFKQYKAHISVSDDQNKYNKKKIPESIYIHMRHMCGNLFNLWGVKQRSHFLLIIKKILKRRSSAKLAKL